MTRLLNWLAMSLACVSAQAVAREPILDVHVHALAADDQGPPPLAMCTPIDPMPTWNPDESTMGNFISIFKDPQCKTPIWSPMTDDEIMTKTLAIMDKYNVIGVVSGTQQHVKKWQAASPARIIPSLMPEFPLPADLAADIGSLKKAGTLSVLGELGFQYMGIAPNDPKLEPLWAAAEEQDIPVAIHMGPGPPGMAYVPGSGYRAFLSSPLLLEDVLVKHPKLRVNVMHAGFPMLDDTLALLYAHPQVYVDVGVIVYTQPKPAFYRYLQAIVDAGFGKRIMFGSDQMVWPETMERSIKVIEEAPFLSKEQKRDIFYNNAARWLHLDDATKSKHMAM